MKVKWVPAADASGDEVMIFLDGVVLIGDLPAAVQVTEFMGHNNTTQCTYFKLHSVISNDYVSYGYEIGMHAESSFWSSEFHKSIHERNGSKKAITFTSVKDLGRASDICNLLSRLRAT